jgi:hypothetical protein
MRSSMRDTERLTAAGVTPATAAAVVKLPDSAARQNNSMLPSKISSNCRFMIDYTMDQMKCLNRYLSNKSK